MSGSNDKQDKNSGQKNYGPAGSLPNQFINIGGGYSAAKFATHNNMSAWHDIQASHAFEAKDSAAEGFHDAMSAYHAKKAGKTFQGRAIKLGTAAVKAGAKLFRKSDEANTMSAFGKDPLIKFFQATGLEKAKLAETLVKVSGIQGAIQANVERWDTEEGAQEAVTYLDGSDLRKAVYLDMYDRGGEKLAKSDGNKINWLTEIAQYSEFTLNKAYPEIVDISFRASGSNGGSAALGSGASSAYGTPTPANTSASATYGTYQSDSAAQPINNSPKVADPDQTTRQGKGMLLAAFKAAIKSKTNPININTTSRVDEKYPAPTGTDLDTTKGTSLTRSEGSTDLQKSISATIADRLHAHADNLAAAVAGGASHINDTAGRLKKSGFAASIRGRGPRAVDEHTFASADESDSASNPANV